MLAFYYIKIHTKICYEVLFQIQIEQIRNTKILQMSIPLIIEYFFCHFRSQKENGSDPQSPVREWWRDLHAWCEPECMTYLQSKPIQNSPLSYRDGTSSTSGLSSNISGSSMLSHNSMSSSTKSSVSSPNGSYLNYDTDNLESLKNIRKLLSGANDIFSTFDSMTKYVFQILHLEIFYFDY